MQLCASCGGGAEDAEPKGWLAVTECSSSVFAWAFLVTIIIIIITSFFFFWDTEAMKVAGDANAELMGELIGLGFC